MCGFGTVNHCDPCGVAARGQAATVADHPVVLADALDALASAVRTQARHVDSARILVARAELMTRLRPYEPRAGCEQIDIMHMAVEGPSNSVIWPGRGR